MHPEILSMALFWIVAAYTPGPNNIVASYSGFNFGIKKTLPHIFGVTFGFTFLIFLLTVGLVNVFKIFPIIQVSLKYFGSLFLIYLACKIYVSKADKENKNDNPVKFIETFLFQFLNPKGVLIGIIIVSTYVEYGEHYLMYATQVIFFAFAISLSSITFWTFVGKYLRKFATNEKYIKYFNCVMSVLLLLSIITFYI
ncbi:LysE family translocator [Pelagibacterales bacterium SAG-MED39]|nr:LysE family translocator [Pelagibacterales bacterium SAG-MED39]